MAFAGALTPVNSAFLLLPVLFVASLAAGLRRRCDSWLQSVLAALVVAGALTAFSTEVLSFFRLIAPAAVRWTWAVFCAISLAVCWRTSEITLRPRLSRRALCALAPMALLLVLVAGSAIYSVHYIADAHLYHIPRIRFWLQNQSVALYTAANLQQLFMPPWAEFAGLHYAALTGVFQGIGLIQVAAMIGSALAAAAIARLLRPEVWTAWIAAALALSIPQGALQTVDLKNDYVCAFWIASAVYFLLLALDRPTRTVYACAGLATGLAVLTKATALLFLSPAVLLVFAAAWRAQRRIPWQFALILASAALALNAPQFQRNMALFGSPQGCESPNCDGVLPFANESLSFKHTVENIARNAGLHLQTPSAALNRATENLLRSGVALAGANIDDPRSLWPGQQFHVRPPHFDPDLLGNPLHFLLALAAGVVVLLDWRRLTPAHRLLLVAVAGGALLFCLVLRWQQWHTRLHLPLFVLAAPLIAASFWSRRVTRVLLTVVAFTLLLLTSVLVARVHARRVTLADVRGHTEPALRHQDLPGIQAALRIRGFGKCGKVGMDAISAHAMEDIPLAILDAGLGPIRVEHINVRNVSARLSPGRSAADYCALICFACADLPGREAAYRQLGFAQFRETGVSAFLKPAAAVAAGMPAGAQYVEVIDPGVGDLSPVADSISGFGTGEGWGRWTTDSTASITLREALPAHMDLAIQAYAFGPNAGREFLLDIDGIRYPLRFGAAPAVVMLSGLRPPSGARTLKFLVPHPASPVELTRKLGLALMRITITARNP